MQPDAYKLLIEGIDPWARGVGFKRGWRLRRDSFARWFRRDGEQYLVFWFQRTNDPWDDHIGSHFTVELQLGAWRFAAFGPKKQRLWRLLDESERGRFRAIQAGTASPCACLRCTSLDTDIWFRYRVVEDVRRWAMFIADVLPAAIARFVGSPPSGSSA